jgi:hypothetical protein
MPTVAVSQRRALGGPTVAAGPCSARARAAEHPVLALQRSHGNAAVSRAIARRRTLARGPARRRGAPIEEPGTGWDGLQHGDQVPRNLTEPMKDAVRRFRNQLEIAMRAKDQKNWARWAAEDTAAFQGTATERATLYAEFQRQMIQVDRTWVANVALGADGSRVFLSSPLLKRTLVVAPDGSLHAGTWDALTEAADGSLSVDYGRLRPVAPRAVAPPVTPPTTDPPPTTKAPTVQDPAVPTVEPPTVKPSTTAVGPTETLAADQVADDFVRKLAAEQEALVLRTGRYVFIGRTLYAVMIVGGIAFLVYDIVQRGPVYAVRDFAIAGTLSEYISLRTGIGLGMVGLALAVAVLLPSDQGGESERQAKAALIDDLIESAFPGTLGGKVFFCYGNKCSGSFREILDHDRYNEVWPQVAAAVEHPFELDDSPRAKAVVAEHKKEAERDKARQAEHDREMAAIREAMRPPVGFYVKGSVGEDGRNDPDDLRRTARRLRELGYLEQETMDPDEIGDAIYLYQSAVLGRRKPDGRIDPRGETERALRAGRRVSMALH